MIWASSDSSVQYDPQRPRTVDALTTAVRHAFAYDAEGRLAGVTDVDGRALRIDRPTQNQVVLIGPDGQVTTLTLVAHRPDGQMTTLTLDASGYVQSIATRECALALPSIASLQDASMPSSRRISPTRPSWWLGPAVMLATLGLLCGVPEVVTRLIDPPLGQYRAIFFACAFTRHFVALRADAGSA
ncbi:MAG: hypothetical protein ACRERC_17990 [Candidatus Binatia bacterium]